MGVSVITSGKMWAPRAALLLAIGCARAKWVTTVNGTHNWVQEYKEATTECVCVPGFHEAKDVSCRIDAKGRLRISHPHMACEHERFMTAEGKCFSRSALTRAWFMSAAASPSVIPTADLPWRFRSSRENAVYMS